ncbi:MAG TPA: DMT family transporter [Acidimicrobiia bacterium]|jgi:drug/metabolite transporter (DMT)-like permease
MTSTTTTATIRDDRAPFSSIDWALFATVGLIWGASFLLIKVGLEAFHPALITWGRVALGAATLAVMPRPPVEIAREDRKTILLLSFTWVAIPFTLFPLAEEHINSAVTGILNGATPIFAGILGAVLFDRAPRGPQRVGIAVGFAGVVLMSAGSSAEGGTAIVGVLMVLAATVFYGLSINLAGRVQQRYGSIAVMSRMLALATVWTAPFGLWGLPRSTFAIDAAAAVAVLGIAGSGIAFVFMATLAGRVGGPRASLATYMIPAVSLVLGVVFLSETVALAALAGIVLVIGGAVLASRRER